VARSQALQWRDVAGGVLPSADAHVRDDADCHVPVAPDVVCSFCPSQPWSASAPRAACAADDRAGWRRFKVGASGDKRHPGWADCRGFWSSRLLPAHGANIVVASILCVDAELGSGDVGRCSSVGEAASCVVGQGNVGISGPGAGSWHSGSEACGGAGDDAALRFSGIGPICYEQSVGDLAGADGDSLVDDALIVSAQKTLSLHLRESRLPNRARGASVRLRCFSRPALLVLCLLLLATVVSMMCGWVASTVMHNGLLVLSQALVTLGFLVLLATVFAALSVMVTLALCWQFLAMGMPTMFGEADAMVARSGLMMSKFALFQGLRSRIVCPAACAAGAMLGSLM
jgi:hypothetical protein